MNQQDWIDYFQAINGRNPSIQEMAEAAKNGEFIRDSHPDEQKVDNTVTTDDIAEEPINNTGAQEVTPGQEETQNQGSSTTEHTETTNPGNDSSYNQFNQTVEAANEFANQANKVLLQAGDNAKATWDKQSKNTRTNFIMGAIVTLPVLLWALAAFFFTLSNGLDYFGAAIFGAFFVLIVFIPAVLIGILPALLNKTEKKWLFFLMSLLLSWTTIGWIVLLLVSINMNKEAERTRQRQTMMQMMAANTANNANPSYQPQPTPEQGFNGQHTGQNSTDNSEQ